MKTCELRERDRKRRAFHDLAAHRARNNVHHSCAWPALNVTAKSRHVCRRFENNPGQSLVSGTVVPFAILPDNDGEVDNEDEDCLTHRSRMTENERAATRARQ